MVVEFKIRNKFVGWDGAPRASVEIDPPDLTPGAQGPAQFSAQANKWGSARINLRGLADGPHVVRVTPEHSSTDPVGPATAGTASPPDRIFRPLQFPIQTGNGQIVSAGVATRSEWGSAQKVNARNVKVLLQPVWAKANSSHARSGDPEMIVMHRTTGAWIGSAINHFLKGKTSAHYIVDHDGQIVKMVQETQVAYHAGKNTHWGGSNGVNGRSIGIEMLNRDGVFADAQFEALLELYGRMYSAIPALKKAKIAGHMEVRTDAGGKLGGSARISCPGIHFKWPKLEGKGYGRVPGGPGGVDGVYDRYFALFPDADLRDGDRDDKQKLGGQKREGFEGEPVKKLQQNLKTLGYSVGRANGRYGDRTAGAVKVFQMHFFADGRGHKAPDGRADKQTAMMMQRLLPAEEPSFSEMTLTQSGDVASAGL